MVDDALYSSLLILLCTQPGANADECPAGSYCPEGTSEPFPCPQGTYSPSFGLTREGECLNCTAGYFCNSTGQHFSGISQLCRWLLPILGGGGVGILQGGGGGGGAQL